MAVLTEEQARGYMHKLLGAMVQADGSDLFISNDFPPTMKAHGHMEALTSQKLTGEVTRVLADAMMLYIEGHISYEEAMRNADSANELRPNIKLKSPRGEPPSATGLKLSFDREPTPDEVEKIRREELAKQQERKRQLDDEELAKLPMQKKAAGQG